MSIDSILNDVKLVLNVGILVAQTAVDAYSYLQTAASLANGTTHLNDQQRAELRAQQERLEAEILSAKADPTPVPATDPVDPSPEAA